MSTISNDTLLSQVGGGHGPNCPHCQALAAEAAERRVRSERSSRTPSPLDVQDEVTLSSDTERAAEIRKLAARDREVRAHEQAHLAAAGRYAAGGASYQFTTGPDGRPYATGGEVPIDVSKVPGDPDATLVKAQAVRRAALALL